MRPNSKITGEVFKRLVFGQLKIILLYEFVEKRFCDTIHGLKLADLLRRAAFPRFTVRLVLDNLQPSLAVRFA